jgi:hypothetical protein
MELTRTRLRSLLPQPLPRGSDGQRCRDPWRCEHRSLVFARCLKDRLPGSDFCALHAHRARKTP